MFIKYYHSVIYLKFIERTDNRELTAFMLTLLNKSTYLYNYQVLAKHMMLIFNYWYWLTKRGSSSKDSRKLPIKVMRGITMLGKK